jgi:pilus assembly protein CpaE
MSALRTVVVIEPDPYLAVSVEALLGELHPLPEMVAVADVAELGEWAPTTGVVVAGPSCATRQAIEELRIFRDRHPAVRIVLAFDRRPGAPMRDVVAVGADALVDPTDPQELRGAVLRSIDLSDALAAALEHRNEVVPGPLGQVFTVCSATGGCGKTFYATNLAFALAKVTGRKVALIDLDLQFGEVMTALRLRPQHTMSDVAVIEDTAELGTYLPEMLTAHESGVWVLPAPLDPAEADRIGPQDVVRVLSALQEHFDYIIVDNPTGLGEATLAALDRSDHLFVLAALDLSSVRNLRLFLQTLERLRIPQDELSLILNKDQTGVGIEAHDIERLFPRGFRSKIPFSREVPRSMNSGVPLLATDPTAPASTELVDGLLDFLPEDSVAAARELTASPARDPWYRRMFTPRPAEN